METIDNIEYTQEILNIFNHGEYDKEDEISIEVKDMVNKIMKDVALSTFERNMHWMPKDKVSARRI